MSISLGKKLPNKKKILITCPWEPYIWCRAIWGPLEPIRKIQAIVRLPSVAYPNIMFLAESQRSWHPELNGNVLDYLVLVSCPWGRSLPMGWTYWQKYGFPGPNSDRDILNNPNRCILTLTLLTNLGWERSPCAEHFSYFFGVFH